MKKELTLTGKLLAGLLLFFISLTLWKGHDNMAIDLQMHDTYLVISSFLLFLYCAAVLLYLFYLIRAIRYRFTRRAVNIILLFVNLLFTGINAYLYLLWRPFGLGLEAIFLILALFSLGTLLLTGIRLRNQSDQ